jgi:hypothetical protein
VVRASDADRDRVVDVLREAVADGRLTPGELDDRLGTALTARTLGELAGLTADLAVAPSGPAAPGEAAQAKAVVRIDQHGGSVRRAGGWVVPLRLELRPKWCQVTLDFTEAVITHGTMCIDLDMRGGSLVLVTGPGIVVDADSLSVRYTDVEIGSAAGPVPGGGDGGVPVTLRVELTGRMRYGRIEAQWPRQRRRPG